MNGTHTSAAPRGADLALAAAAGPVVIGMANGPTPRTVHGVRFGEWVAWEPRAGDPIIAEKPPGTWTLGHAPSDFPFAWTGPETAARHAAQLLSERMPGWEPDDRESTTHLRAVWRDVDVAVADRLAGRPEGVPVRLALPKREHEDEPRIFDAIAYGEWAAVHCVDHLGRDAGAWTLGHIASGMLTGLRAHRTLALAVAREMAVRLPTWTPGPPTPQAPFPRPDGWTPPPPSLEWEAFRAAAEPAIEAARATLPELRARPFRVSITKRAYVVVLAETIDAANSALLGVDDEDLEAHLGNAYVEWDASEIGASYAASDAGLYVGRDGSVDHRGRVFYAIDGALYEPDLAPARMYLDIDPEHDHAYDCPARPKRSALGDVEPGTCKCLLRAYPQKPAPAAEGTR